MSELGDYKGVPIIGTGITVTKLGDGLSKAMKIEPVVVEAGEVVHLIVRAVKTKDHYDYEMDSDGEITGVRLVQVFQASGARFSEADVVRSGIDEMAALIAKREAEEKGQLPLDLDGLGAIDGDEPGEDDLNAYGDLPPIAAERRAEYGDLPDTVDELMGGGADD